LPNFFAILARCFEWLLLANSSIKILVFFIIWTIAWLPLAIPIAWRLDWNPKKPITTREKLPLVASLYAIAPLILWGAIAFEGVSLSDWGLSLQAHFFFSAIAGIALAIFGLATIFTIESRLGWLQWQRENYPQLRSLLLPLLALGLWISLTEEVIFRGFLLSELQQDQSFLVAAILSSTIFSLLHLLWDRKQTIAQLPGLWLMGMLLVAARAIDRGSLGLACGLHAGWIWGLSSIDSARLFTYTGIGAPWLTGIGGQPLAGVAGILCLCGTGVILIWYQKLGF
jgi:membrane protease YdiL (CAAX protease family)